MRSRIVIALSLALTLLGRTPAAAHGSQPRLELGAERANPGSAVELRGVDFEPEEAVALGLAGAGLELALEEFTADAEGAFIRSVLLPADLPEGSYRFRALTDDHQVFSPPLAVEGIAVEGEEGEPRGQEEGLLAPMPTPAQPAVAAEPSLPPAAILALGALAAGLGWLMLRRLKSEV